MLIFLLAAGPCLAASPALRVLVMGDFNGPYGSLTYPRQVAAVLGEVPGWQPDLVIMPGDLVAGQDARLPPERFGQMWEAFDSLVAGPLRQASVPYAPAMGNHDASGAGPAYARERQAAETYWNGSQYLQNLAYVDRGNMPFRYSFTAGPVFVMVWDASTAAVGAAQLEWLEQQLQTPEAQGAGHRWLVGHLPVTGVAEGRDTPGEVLHDGPALARRLADAGVDLYISGHQAAYYPTSLNGLELLNSGGIGARRLLGSSSALRSAVVLVDVMPDGSVLYTGIDADTLEPVDPATLPSGISTAAGVLQLSKRANGSIIRP